MGERLAGFRGGGQSFTSKAPSCWHEGSSEPNSTARRPWTAPPGRFFVLEEHPCPAATESPHPTPARNARSRPESCVGYLRQPTIHNVVGISLRDGGWLYPDQSRNIPHLHAGAKIQGDIRMAQHMRVDLPPEDAPGVGMIRDEMVPQALKALLAGGPGGAWKAADAGQRDHPVVVARLSARLFQHWKQAPVDRRDRAGLDGMRDLACGVTKVDHRRL